jgi:NTE family protein
MRKAASDIRTGRQRDRQTYDGFQADQEVAVAFQHPTELNAIPEASFDHIARHGYELADATLTAYWPDEFSRSLTWT